MLRLNNLTHAHKRRTLRPLLAHTQATPVPMELSSSFSRTGGALTGTATTGITDNTMGAILPGMVAMKQVGRTVTPHYTASVRERSFGLFGQFVGGDLDELKGAAEVSVWSGPGSHWEVLAPAFDDTNLSTAAAAEDGTDALEVYLNANAKAQLGVLTPGDPLGAPDGAGAEEDDVATLGTAALGRTARLIERISANAIVVQLLV